MWDVLPSERSRRAELGSSPRNSSSAGRRNPTNPARGNLVKIQRDTFVVTDVAKRAQHSTRVGHRGFGPGRDSVGSRTPLWFARTDTRMNIGIIADTHDNVDAAERAAEIFAEEGVEIVVHCGDFIARRCCPPSRVRGPRRPRNNDGEISGLEVAFDDLGSESELHGRFASLEFDGSPPLPFSTASRRRRSRHSPTPRRTTSSVTATTTSESGRNVVERQCSILADSSRRSRTTTGPSRSSIRARVCPVPIGPRVISAKAQLTPVLGR